MNATVEEVHEGLRAWAAGVTPTVAGVELLIHAGWAGPGYPWCLKASREGRWVIDTDRLAEEMGVLSGGERAVVAIALSLIGPNVDDSDERDYARVDLNDTLTRMDSRNTRFVLTALVQATGAPFQEPAFDAATGRVTGYAETMPALYRWEDVQ